MKCIGIQRQQCILVLKQWGDMYSRLDSQSLEDTWWRKYKTQSERCQYLRKKVIDEEMGPISKHSITRAPAFYATQADICGPFKAYSLHRKRTTIKIWLIVYCCILTSTTSKKLMHNYSEQAFIQAFIRFSCKVGYRKFMVIDEGNQLIKGYDNIKISFTDIKGKLHRDMMIYFAVCWVGGYNYNGKVERRIKHVKESLEKTISNQRLSVLQWETVAAELLNAINDLPLAPWNIVSDF